MSLNTITRDQIQTELNILTTVEADPIQIIAAGTAQLTVVETVHKIAVDIIQTTELLLAQIMAIIN